MAYFLQGLFGERSLTKVAGFFNQRAQAEAVMEQLRNEAGLDKTQVRLLRPQDAIASNRELFGHTVEPESAGVARTLVQTHLVGGLAGAMLGLALFMWLSRAGNPLLASIPVIGFVVIVGFGITFGLLAAGLIALRPDHIMLTSQLRAALNENRWVLIAHPVNSDQVANVKRLLEASTAEVHSTM